MSDGVVRKHRPIALGDVIAHFVTHERNVIAGRLVRPALDGVVALLHGPRGCGQRYPDSPTPDVIQQSTSRVPGACYIR